MTPSPPINLSFDWKATQHYDHSLPPNSPGCLPITAPTGAGEFFGAVLRSLFPASSLHPGGVNLLLCDGSVRFVLSSVDGPLWEAVGTRSNGELVPDNF